MHLKDNISVIGVNTGYAIHPMKSLRGQNNCSSLPIQPVGSFEPISPFIYNVAPSVIMPGGGTEYSKVVKSACVFVHNSYCTYFQVPKSLWVTAVDETFLDEHLLHGVIGVYTEWLHQTI